MRKVWNNERGEKMVQKNNRNYGIDFLRIVALLGVITLHILGHGGVLSNVKTNAGYAVVWFLEILAYPSVNCFILVSGFVGYREKRYYPRLRNILQLFLTVLFYSVLLCLAIKAFYPEQIGMKDIIISFLPITTQQYWFFTSYFAMFLVSPMINMFVDTADRKMIGVSYAVILLLSCISLKSDWFFLHGGYSFIWFVIVYFIGAAMKKYQIMQKLSTLKCVLLLCMTLLITWLPKMTYLFYQSDGLAKTVQNCLISYASPTILFMAMLTLTLFQRIPINVRMGKLITFFSASAFSVYLIHDNKHVRSLCIAERFAFLNEQNPFVMVGVVILCVLAIYFVCTLVDKVRSCLFKILRIEKFTEMLEKWFKRIVVYGESLCKKS